MLKLRRIFTKVTFGSLTLVFTILVLANSYELIANQDILLGTALSQSTIQTPINKVIDEFDPSYSSKMLEGNAKLGPLDALEIPSLGIWVQLEEARKIDDLWYRRPSMAQYIELNQDSYGNAVDYLIYSGKSWRSIPYVEEIEEGTEINVITKKGYAASFIVESRKALPQNSAFIVGKSEKRQIVLMIEDESNSRYYGYSLVSTR